MSKPTVLPQEVVSILDGVADLMFILDRQWRFVYISEQIQKRAKPTILGKVIWDLYPDLIGSDFERNYKTALKTQQPVSFEAYFVPLKSWYQVQAYPSKKGLLVYFSDVTKTRDDRQQAEIYDEHFKSLADTIPQLVWINKPDGTNEYFNKRWYDFTHRNPEEQMEDFGEYVHPDDLAEAQKLWKRSLKTGQPYEMEFRLHDGRGGYCWFLGRALPIKNSVGRIVRWFGTCTDIDDQKRNLEFHKFLVEASSLLSSSLDFETTLKSVANFAVPKIADWCSVTLSRGDELLQVAVAHKDPKKVKWAKEISKKYPTEMDSPTGVPNVLRTGTSEFYPVITEETLKAVAKDKEHYTLIKKIGFSSAMVVPIKVHDETIGAITFVAAESGKHFNQYDLQMAEELAMRAGLAIENSQLFQEAHKSEIKYNTLVNANIIGVFSGTFEGKLLDINPIFLQLIGKTFEDFENQDISITEIIGPSDTFLEEILPKLKKEGSIPPFETELIRYDGTRVPVMIGLVSLNINSKYIGFVLDITERKELERRKDEFIGIASHELKTPLTSIKGYVQILENIISELRNDKAQVLLTKANNYIDRLDSLIGDLLDISKIQAGKLQFNTSTFDFDEMITEGVESIQPIVTSHLITIKGKTGVKITGDKHRLEQVVTNLLTNAIKYSPKSDRVLVRVKKKTKEVQVDVVDYGIGVPTEQIPLLFERFYRVEKNAQEYSGLGIGLYIAAEIIKRHGGEIWAESKEGQGSTFSFTLPINK